MSCRQGLQHRRGSYRLLAPTLQDKGRLHARRRAWQRYGTALNDADVRRLEQQIWRGEADWICDQANMRSAYAVRFLGRRMIAIFDIHIEAIITFLPSEAWAMEAAIGAAP
jgi:hypothetical protein